MRSRWQPQLDVARTCGTLEVLRMTTSDDRVRGVVTTTLIVRADVGWTPATEPGGCSTQALAGARKAPPSEDGTS